jgi:hypothetical protein
MQLKPSISSVGLMQQYDLERQFEVNTAEGY